MKKATIPALAAVGLFLLGIVLGCVGRGMYEGSQDMAQDQQLVQLQLEADDFLNQLGAAVAQWDIDWLSGKVAEAKDPEATAPLVEEALAPLSHGELTYGGHEEGHTIYLTPGQMCREYDLIFAVTGPLPQADALPSYEVEKIQATGRVAVTVRLFKEPGKPWSWSIQTIQGHP